MIGIKEANLAKYLLKLAGEDGAISAAVPQVWFHLSFSSPWIVFIPVDHCRLMVMLAGDWITSWDEKYMKEKEADGVGLE